MRNLLFVAALAAAGTAGADCLKDGDSVMLSGKVVAKVFPGPPNYYSIQQGDQPENAWLLVLDKPECVQARSEDNGAIYTLPGPVQVVQMAFKTQGVADLYSQMIGHHVQAAGMLAVNSSPHVHAPAVLGVDAMKKSFPW